MAKKNLTSFFIVEPPHVGMLLLCVAFVFCVHNTTQHTRAPSMSLCEKCISGMCLNYNFAHSQITPYF